jgi:alkylmercury lyase
MNKPNLYEISEALRQSGIDVPSLGPDVPAFLLQLWRHLAEGRPVSPRQVEQMITAHQFSPLVLTQSQAGLEYDDEGNIVGAVGLSLNPSSYHFRVNGHTLSTWCAWDALFIPLFLDQRVEVEAQCPATQQSVRMTITSERVVHYEPASAVVSIIVPKPATLSKAKSAEEVWMAFCNHVHFFSSPEAAREWFLGRGHDPILLSIEEGYELGRLRFAAMSTRIVEEPQ